MIKQRNTTKHCANTNIRFTEREHIPTRQSPYYRQSATRPTEQHYAVVTIIVIYFDNKNSFSIAI